MVAIPGFADPFSSISHLSGVIASLIGSYFLIKRSRGSALRISALIVYIFGMLFLFSMSGVYHLLSHDHTPRIVFQRLDHAAIWIMIAGTFTPIHVILFRGWWRWGVLALIWALAISGLVLKTVFFTDIPLWASLSFYLLLGWMGLFSAWKAYRLHGLRLVSLLILGGISYSLGALFEGIGSTVVVPGFIESHEIFHIFVMAGAAFHWFFIYQFADEPVFDHITFTVIEYNNHKFVAQAKGERISVSASSKTDLIPEIKSALAKRYTGYTCPSHIHLKFIEVHTI